MENSETQVINLGKLLVKELGLEYSVDTLGRWMAHYIAEKIVSAENCVSKAEKVSLNKDTFETILKLWEHRWSLSSRMWPLEDFKPILEVLKRLDPDRHEPFFYRLSEHDLSEMCKDGLHQKELSAYIKTVVEIDKIARIWIDTILHKAASLSNNEKVQTILENAANLSDTEDIQIVRILSEDSLNEPLDEERWERKERGKTLESRIKELERYAELNNVLLDHYRKELAAIQEDQP